MNRVTKEYLFIGVYLPGIRYICRISGPSLILILTFLAALPPGQVIMSRVFALPKLECCYFFLRNQTARLYIYTPGKRVN